MRKLYFVSCLLAAGALFAAAGPDEAALRAAMKAAGPGHGALGKKIAAKDASAAADAKTLGAAFASTKKFWKAKKMDDAAGFNTTAVNSYKAIAKAVAAGKWDDATAAHKAASDTCKGCHTAHRTKGADGAYAVK